MQRITNTILLSIAFVGCGGGTESLGHQIDDAQDHVDELRAEVETHVGGALGASELATLRDTEPSHDAILRGHMDDLGHAIGDMAMCDGAPDDRVDAMMQVRQGCIEEGERHAEASLAASDLELVRAEEQRHEATMADCLDELDEMMSDMMHDHAATMCRGHHGEDDHDRP